MSNTPIKIETDLSTILERIETKIDRIEQKFESRIDNIEQKFEARFDKLDERLNKLEMRSHSDNLNGLNRRYRYKKPRLSVY